MISAMTPDLNRLENVSYSRMQACLATMDYLQMEYHDVQALAKESVPNAEINLAEINPEEQKQQYEQFNQICEEISTLITSKFDLKEPNLMSHISLNLLAHLNGLQNELLTDAKKEGLTAAIAAITDLKTTTNTVLDDNINPQQKLIHINTLIRKTDNSRFSPDTKKAITDFAITLIACSLTFIFYASLMPLALIAKGLLLGVHLNYLQAAAMFYPTNIMVPLIISIIKLRLNFFDLFSVDYSLRPKQVSTLGYLKMLTLWATPPKPSNAININNNTESISSAPQSPPRASHA